MKCVFTNTVPTGPYRGAGRPESKYIVERLIDQAAREIGHDRVELRRRNLIAPEAMPYTTPHGVTYDTGDFPAVLEEALTAADWAGFAARRQQSTASGRLRGIGICCYLETTAPSGRELGDIRFEADGRVTFRTGTLDFGQGHRVAFAQVLSARLGIPLELIDVRQDDTEPMIAGGGSGGSRSAIASSGAILEASDGVIEKGRKLAGHLLEAAEEDIEFERGRFRVTGTDRAIGLLELAREIRDRDLPHALDTAIDHTTAPSSYPNGCHVSEVEIDPETGQAVLVRHTVVDDFGNVINPLLVEGQVHGGIAQGVGQALMEDAVYDADGQLLTGSLMDYCLPRAGDLPSFGFAMHPVPATTNPLGLKGCGEGGVAGSLPAAMNAVTDALASAGVTEPIDAPATPFRVWRALRSARQAG